MLKEIPLVFRYLQSLFTNANWSHSRWSSRSGFLSVFDSSVCHAVVHFRFELMMMIFLNFLTNHQRFIESFPKISQENKTGI